MSNVKINLKINFNKEKWKIYSVSFLNFKLREYNNVKIKVENHIVKNGNWEI